MGTATGNSQNPAKPKDVDPIGYAILVFHKNILVRALVVYGTARHRPAPAMTHLRKAYPRIAHSTAYLGMAHPRKTYPGMAHPRKAYPGMAHLVETHPSVGGKAIKGPERPNTCI
jgi:hypothetical protein